MIINPGEFNYKVSLLSIEKTGNVYGWTETARIWSKYEHLTGTNIFSQVGIGARSIKFTMRKTSKISLHNAFLWNGRHCFLTNIVEIDRMYLEITAALIDPKTCIVKRDGELTKNELNRPVYSDSVLLSFPGCLTEKFVGYTQNDPMAVTEVRYVIIAPKVIELEIGELVTIENRTYNVQIKHALDEYKNEYEVEYRGDV